jgi:hypothetical protein
MAGLTLKKLIFIIFIILTQSQLLCYVLKRPFKFTMTPQIHDRILLTDDALNPCKRPELVCVEVTGSVYQEHSRYYRYFESSTG